MDWQPDVLDHLGKTPREFGAVHAHFELVRQNALGQAEAVVWFQAAFSRAKAPGEISFFTAEHAPLLACHDLPPLEDGRVVRVVFPFALAHGNRRVLARIDSERPEHGARIRPAWLLADTIEVPKQGLLDDIAALERFDNPTFGRQPLNDPLGLTDDDDDLQRLRREARTVVHRARKLPSFLAADVVAGAVDTIGEPAVTVVWKPGEPLPSAAPLIPAGTPRMAESRRCYACGFAGDAAKYEKDISCPACGAPWP